MTPAAPLRNFEEFGRRAILSRVQDAKPAPETPPPRRPDSTSNSHRRRPTQLAPSAQKAAVGAVVFSAIRNVYRRR